MKKVGISGNADQHFSSDWIDVEVVDDEDLFNQKPELSSDGDSCEFPSVRVVEIFYKRINTDKDPQYIIMKMQHYSPEVVQWKYTQPTKPGEASTKKQTFQASVIVNSFIIDQDLDLFVPSFEDIIEPLQRNVLYPFFVYEGEEN